MRTTLDGIIKAYMGDFQTVHIHTKREGGYVCAWHFPPTTNGLVDIWCVEDKGYSLYLLGS